MAEQQRKDKSTVPTDGAVEEGVYLPKPRSVRIKPASNGKTSKAKRTYHAETLGLPPLKMVLVHAANDRANAALKLVSKPKSKTTLTQEEAVMKIIEHLTKAQ
jgi:hypothetical protein